MNSTQKRGPIFYYIIHNQSFNLCGLSAYTYKFFSNFISVNKILETLAPHSVLSLS